MHERGLPPLEAIQALIRLIIDTISVAAQTGDHALLQLVPSLEPFFPLSPAIERLQSFLTDVKAASPQSAVTVPKYFEPIKVR